MTIDEVVQYFGNLNQACIALKISPQNMTLWKRQGYITYLQQHRIATITGGDLMPDEVDPLSIFNPMARRRPKKI